MVTKQTPPRCAILARRDCDRRDSRPGPPLAFSAAHLAGLPAIAIGNFTWDWIYEGYRGALERRPKLLPRIRRAYGHATSMLRLPMWGGFDRWQCPITDVPFVARHSARSAREVREQLGVPAGSRVALASFGGLGITGLPLGPLARLDGWSLVTTAHALEAVGPVPPGVRVIEDAAVAGQAPPKRPRTDGARVAASRLLAAS